MVDEVYDAVNEDGDITKVAILIRNASLQALQRALLVAEFPADASARWCPGACPPPDTTSARNRRGMPDQVGHDEEAFSTSLEMTK